MALMEHIRSQTQSGLSYILVGVLIVFFAVFFGVPADGCAAGGGRVLMARVAGADIYTEDVNIIYHRYYGSQSNIEPEQYANQQAQALRIVLMIHVLADRAEEIGLRVSDEEFIAYIQNPLRNFEFLTQYGATGEFDGPYYERYVQNLLRTPIQRYEAFKRRELLARKYLTMLHMQVNVTPTEIEELNELRNTRINLEFVRISEDLLADLAGIDDEAMEAFLAEHGDRVQQYYEENQADYESDERMQIRQIYIVKPGDGAEAQEAQDKFDEARNRIVEQGEDFGEVASELSEDFARADGGLMSMTSPANMNQDVVNALEGADVGEIREVETDFAYILVRLEDREEARITPLEEVQEDIVRSLMRDDVVSGRGQEIAQRLHNRVADGLSLQDALTALEEEAREAEREDDAELWASLSVQNTGLFNLEGQPAPPEIRAQFGAGFGRAWDQLPRLGTNRDLVLTAFQLTTDEPLVDEVVEFDDSLAVVRLLDREDASEELTASERSELEMEVRILKVQEFLGPYHPLLGHALFIQPMQEVGEYLEGIFLEALEDGTIRLYERNSRAAQLVRQMAQAPAADAVDGPSGDSPGGQVIQVQ